MAASPVTPTPLLTSQVQVGSTPVTIAPGGINGGIVQNPYDAADQGIANTEPIYIDPTGAPATVVGNGTSFRLEAGQWWQMIPGQTTTTSMNAATNGHKVAGVIY